MVNECPKCNKEFISKSFFGSPDESGIIACISHNTETKTGMFGESFEVESDRCFLTQEQWDLIK